LIEKVLCTFLASLIVKKIWRGRRKRKEKKKKWGFDQ